MFARGGLVLIDGGLLSSDLAGGCLLGSGLATEGGHPGPVLTDGSLLGIRRTKDTNLLLCVTGMAYFEGILLVTC